MLSTVNKTFSDWLNDKLIEKGWSQADLARKTGASRTAISNLLSEKRDLGPDLGKSIAQALGISEEEVFRAAGLLKAKQLDEYAERLAHRISLLPPEEQEILDAMIDGLLQKRGKQSENNGIKKNPAGAAG